jgi:propanediol dehydratase small subunit
MSDVKGLGEGAGSAKTDDDPRKKASRIDFADITLEAFRSGKILPSDLTIKRERLLDQAALAEQHGYPQFARNLRRAAELTAIPDDFLLEIYEKLRPNRATYYQLLSLSQEISARYDAPETSEYIRHAAEAYRAMGLLVAEGL